MSKFRTAKTSLGSGEISEDVFGRTDLAQYPSACKTLKNMIPRMVGGADRRPGTMFDTSLGLASANYAPGLIPFIYSQQEVYMIAVGQSTTGPSSVTRIFRPVNNTGQSIEATVSGDLPTRAATAQGAGDAKFAIEGIYDEWHDIKFVQSADVMFAVHWNRIPYRVERQAIDSFLLSEYNSFSVIPAAAADKTELIPFQTKNTTAITLTISNDTVGTGRTLTSTAALFVSGMEGVAGGSGVYYKIKNGANYGLVRVTGFTSTTQVTVEVIVALGATGAPVALLGDFWESAWSDYRGWPRAVSVYKNRLCYLGTRSFPDTMWFSQKDNYYILSAQAVTDPFSGPTGTQPFTFSLLSNQLNPIQWAVQGNHLAVGTNGEEWLVKPIDETGALTANNIKAEPQTYYGSSYTQAANIGNEVVFNTRDLVDLRSFIFNFQEESFTGEPIKVLYNQFPKPDLSIYSPGNKKIRTMAWDRSRNTLWCLDTAGNLFGVTRDRRLTVNAWHQHELGGYDATVTGSHLGAGVDQTIDPNYTNPTGSICSIATLPNPRLGIDDLWLVVKRKINGTFRYYLERMIGKSMPYDTVVGGVPAGIGLYLTDCSLLNAHAAHDGDTLTTDFSHLTGESIDGYASNNNGLFHVAGTVGASLFTITGAKPGGWTSVASIVFAGYNYNSIVEPVRPEAGSQIGTSQGAVKRHHEVTVRFFRTLAAKIGRDADNLETMVLPDPATMVQSKELLNGDYKVFFMGDYDRDGYVYILQDVPLPFAVLSVYAEGMVMD